MDEEEVDALSVKVAPNPSSSSFTLMISTKQPEPVSKWIIDMSGRVMSEYRKVLPNTTLRAGERLKDGIYFAEVVQNKQRVVVKLMKTR